MPLVRYALAGAAAASLLGGAAYAHHYRHHHAQPTAERAQERARAAETAAAPTSAEVNGQTVEVISSPPVPDTPENRAKYGQPLSHAGKMTRPIGD